LKLLKWSRDSTRRLIELATPRPLGQRAGRSYVQARSELAAALHRCRGAFAGIAIMSGVLNVLGLTGSFFMLEVYDRVLPSRSVPTLIGLMVIAAILYACHGLLDLIRGRILVRIGGAIDEALSGRVYDLVARLPLRGRNASNGLQPIQDLDQVRSFLSGAGPAALFDLPWMPVYLAICFLFHFSLGIATTLASLILIAMTLATEILSRHPVRLAATLGLERNMLAEATRRNAEVLHAMGMAGRIGAVWGETNTKFMDANQRTADVGGGLASVSRALRLLVQSLVLAIGAYLVIEQKASAGIIIAASIISARALSPVEQAIGQWRAFVAARQSWRRLNDLLVALPPESLSMQLPAPASELLVENVSVVPPRGRNTVVQGISFRLQAGHGLGIIGPSGSGKSSLVRTLVGAWLPIRGTIRLDGAALEQWSSEKLGRHVGYLPQDVELFAGTVAQNISRFDPQSDPTAIIAAAKAAGVHELILRLRDGYETQIGEGGAALSAGQRQRIGLARALYGDPFLVVLDEPNSNLDMEGDEALGQAVLSVRNRGGILVIVAHRASALAAVDLVLVMSEGRAQALGPRDEIMSKLFRPVQVTPTPAPIPVRPVARDSIAS
jgi:ATP-binding cassette, subfamily C, type I secretion system permease/ATPase